MITAKIIQQLMSDLFFITKVAILVTTVKTREQDIKRKAGLRIFVTFAYDPNSNPRTRHGKYG